MVEFGCNPDDKNAPRFAVSHIHVKGTRTFVPIVYDRKLQKRIYPCNCTLHPSEATNHKENCPAKFRKGENKMPKIIVMKELKTQQEIIDVVAGKTVKDVTYKAGYSNIDINFTDGSWISIYGEDCFDFRVEIQDTEER